MFGPPLRVQSITAGIHGETVGQMLNGDLVFVVERIGAGARHARDARRSGDGALTIRLSARATRYLRLRQTSRDPVNGWAIAELSVFASPALSPQP